MLQPLVMLYASAVLGADVPPKLATSTFPSLPRPLLLHPDTASHLSEMHQRANEMAFSGDLRGARTAYLTLIAYQDSASVFPGEAQWALASLEYGADRELRSAEVLDELADAAMRYGRADWEARALLEAGLIYQRHGRSDVSVVRARRLKLLLTSPAISASLRAQLAERVGMR